MWPSTYGGKIDVPGCQRKPIWPQKSPSHSHASVARQALHLRAVGQGDRTALAFAVVERGHECRRIGLDLRQLLERRSFAADVIGVESATAQRIGVGLKTVKGGNDELHGLL
jgi:4'-phosphopantetheinyl transferase EntD